MPSPVPNPDAQHPLQDEPARLDQIVDVMYAEIHKVLKWHNPGRRPGAEGAISLVGDGTQERVIVGTGTSADDILAEACFALLTYPPERLTRTWEGLSVRIARNKTIEALRKAGKGLKGTPHRGHLHVVYGDQPGPQGGDGDVTPSILDVLPDEGGGPEEEYFANAAALLVRDLARELLTRRDQQVFFGIHFEECSRKEMGRTVGLSSQRVSQIYLAALERLEGDPRYPFRSAQEDAEGGHDEQPE